MIKQVVKISIFSMSMLTAAAVVTLRGLPMMAKEEFTLFFYIGFAVVMFLIPASLVAAELGSMFGAQEGGVYTWVKEAFGERCGFIAIWLQWIQNVIWYPVELGFAAAIVAYIVGDGPLASDGVYTGLFCIAGYWLATWLALYGGNIINRITSYGFLIGTILPAVFLLICAVIWILLGNQAGFEHLSGSDNLVAKIVNGTVHPRWLPDLTRLDNIAFLAGVIMLFAGVEVHAVQANRMKNPQVEYPIALLFMAVIAFLVFTVGAFSIAAIMPYGQINLEAGLIQTFHKVFTGLGAVWAVPVIGILIFFGAMASVTSWITGPSLGLLQTAKDGMLPQFMAKINRHGVQRNILLVQAGIVTAFSCIYFLFEDVSVSWFLISISTITLYLIMYGFMYLAVIRLRYTRPDMPRKFRIPGGMPGLWVTGLIGLSGVGFSFIVGFFPPAQLPVGNPEMYVTLVIAGTVIFTGIPVFLKKSIKTR